MMDHIRSCPSETQLLYALTGSCRYVVSPWMDYGDAISYVNKYPYVNRKRIIHRIAKGIKLLHSYNPPIVHGDIKGANILINPKGNPLLADFGLSKVCGVFLSTR